MPEWHCHPVRERVSGHAGQACSELHAHEIWRGVCLLNGLLNSIRRLYCKREDKNVPTTEENLKEAFAGESQANRKYLAFAKKAEQDGFANVARLFRTAAEAETIHAMGHLQALGGVSTTAENLRAAVAGETYEYTEMYPPMLAQAEADGHKARRMFGYAVKAEAVHAQLYKLALEAVEQGKDLTDISFYLCPVCGYIELGSAPDACPICGTHKDKFVQVG
jgi:rubrerythrin